MLLVAEDVLRETVPELLMTHLNEVDHRPCKSPSQSFSAPAGLSRRVNQINLVSAAELIVMVPKFGEGTKMNSSAKSLTVQDLPILSLRTGKFKKLLIFGGLFSGIKLNCYHSLPQPRKSRSCCKVLCRCRNFTCRQ